jgi:hypothetical protein
MRYIPETFRPNLSMTEPSMWILFLNIPEKQLKEKYQDSTTSKSLKLTTILPKSWSIWEVQEVFPSASNYMIRRAKQLVMDQGT